MVAMMALRLFSGHRRGVFLGPRSPDRMISPNGQEAQEARTPSRRVGSSADVVLFDTRGRQVNPLPTTMTVAEALEDTLGPRC